MRMAISRAPSALLGYLNASPAGERGCVKRKNESTDRIEMPKYPMDCIESVLVRFVGSPPTSVQSFLKEKLTLLFSTASV